MDSTVWIAFLITLFAGLSTGIGSLIAFFANKTNRNLLVFSLGFSAGVMIYISFIEILPEAIHFLSIEHGNNGEWHAILTFFLGIILSLIIDKSVPESKNPHEMRLVENMNEDIKKKKLHRLGLFTAFAITIHNFPEGIATFMAAYKDLEIGIPVAIAVAIHNIPEGIAVAVPIYYATGSRSQAMKWSFLSGLSEPLGAIVAFLILMPFFTDAMFGYILAMVAGIMVFISFDELLPGAREHGENHHMSTYGVFIGMFIMALSLLIL
jgi:zinc transporter, ZIP family